MGHFGTWADVHGDVGLKARLDDLGSFPSHKAGSEEHSGPAGVSASQFLFRCRSSRTRVLQAGETLAKIISPTELSPHIPKTV